jgi:hypothetical protein
VRKERKPLEEFWSKVFPITSITRADLIAAGISRTIVVKLTDEEMRQIASEMEDVYRDHGYWEDIRLAFERVKG